MADYPLDRSYSESIEQLTTKSPAHANTFNPIFKRLLNNDAYHKDTLDSHDSQLADIAINVKNYKCSDGQYVQGDGVHDDTSGIIAAEAAAYTLGDSGRLIMRGTFKTTAPIKIRCALDASRATINYYGTGTALVLGDDSAPAIVIARTTYHLPRVINMSRGTTGWDGTSVGVKCVNLNACDVYVPFIQDFEQGLLVYGYSQGTAYTTFFLRQLWENHKNLVLDGDATGWVNQNVFVNGRLQQSATKGATVDDQNAKQVDLSSAIQPNNNTFINTSLEGTIAYYKADISGRNNHFYNCRWEAQGGTPRVRYRSTAYHNKIDGGYNVSNIVETFDGNLGGGEVRDGYGAYTSASATAGQVIPTGVWTAINSWDTPVSRRISYNAATGEFTPRAGRWRISATACFAPNATGRRMMKLTANGSAIDIFEVPGNANRNSMKVENIYRFDGTTTFKIEVQQTSGADLALETTVPYVRIQAEYLGYS